MKSMRSEQTFDERRLLLALFLDSMAARGRSLLGLGSFIGLGGFRCLGRL